MPHHEFSLHALIEAVVLAAIGMGILVISFLNAFQKLVSSWEGCNGKKLSQRGHVIGMIVISVLAGYIGVASGFYYQFAAAAPNTRSAGEIKGTPRVPTPHKRHRQRNRGNGTGSGKSSAEVAPCPAADKAMIPSPCDADAILGRPSTPVEKNDSEGAHARRDTEIPDRRLYSLQR